MARRSVLTNFTGFTSPLEGDHITWLYPDVKNYITTGDGNLVDPVTAALLLAWKNPDGSLASAAEVTAEWNHLKSLNLGQAGAWSAAVKNATKVRLTAADVDALILKQLLANEAVLRKEYPDWDKYSADAQMAMFSMSWALGPAFVHQFGNFYKSALAGKWFECELECDISTTGNAGVKKRNIADKLCLHNAGMVAQYGLDPEILYWPNAAGAEVQPQPQKDDELQRLANIALADSYGRLVAAGGHAGSDGIAEEHGDDADEITRPLV